MWSKVRRNSYKFSSDNNKTISSLETMIGTGSWPPQKWRITLMMSPLQNLISSHKHSASCTEEAVGLAICVKSTKKKLLAIKHCY